MIPSAWFVSLLRRPCLSGIIPVYHIRGIGILRAILNWICRYLLLWEEFENSLELRLLPELRGTDVFVMPYTQYKSKCRTGNKGRQCVENITLVNYWRLNIGTRNTMFSILTCFNYITFRQNMCPDIVQNWQTNATPHKMISLSTCTRTQNI